MLLKSKIPVRRLVGKKHILIAAFFWTGSDSLWQILKQRWWKYFFLGLADVEANYMIVKAYQYTTLTSVQVRTNLSFWTVAFITVLDWFLKWDSWDRHGSYLSLKKLSNIYFLSAVHGRASCIMNNVSRKQRKLAGVTQCQLLSWTLIILIERTSKSLLTATQVFLLTENKDLGPDNTHSVWVLADEWCRSLGWSQKLWEALWNVTP